MEPRHDPTQSDMAAVERHAQRFRRVHNRWQSFLQRHPVLRVAYRAALLLVAGVILLAGILMLFLPGPGWLTIFFGLALLGSEFAWARRLLAWLRMQVQSWWHRLRVWRRARAADRAERRRRREQRLANGGDEGRPATGGNAGRPARVRVTP